jgi:hypothetical protein
VSHFEDILKRSLEIHKKKREDYATHPDENPHENFERANIIASWFPDEYKSFAVLIGVKLARLAALLSSGRKPNNEALDDSFLDDITYTAIMFDFWKRKQLNPNAEFKQVKDWIENRKAVEQKTNWQITCKTCKLPIEPNSILYLDKQYFAHHKRCDQMSDLRIP